MQCPRCQKENRQGRRFCSECGASLALACSSCGSSNEPGEKFCGGCGQPFSFSRSPNAKFTSPESYTPKYLAEKLPDLDEVVPLSARHLAFVGPLILIHLACGLVFVTGSSRAAAMVFLLTCTAQLFGLTMGYHRLLAHRSFGTSRSFQFFLALLGTLAGQNGPLWWVGHHIHHHRYADQDGDIHSPRAGIFWSHMGWLFSPRIIPVRHELVTGLARLPEMRLLQQYSYAVILVYTLLLYVLGVTWGRLDPSTGLGGLQLVVWGAVLSTVCVYHITLCVGSVAHLYGTRPFSTRDDSRNNVLLAILMFGDGWHNNHHYCPSSARMGFRWWEFDLNYGLLRLLERFGIVWDLRAPPEATARRRREAASAQAEAPRQRTDV